MADDVDIDFEKMKLWDAEKVTYYFENGGEEQPAAWQQPPCVPLSPVRVPVLLPLARARSPAPRSSSPPSLAGLWPRPTAAATTLAPQVDDATFKKWFPKWKKPETLPKFRIVCFHNAGSAESNYTGKGLRMPNDNP